MCRQDQPRFFRTAIAREGAEFSHGALVPLVEHLDAGEQLGEIEFRASSDVAEVDLRLRHFRLSAIQGDQKQLRKAAMDLGFDILDFDKKLLDLADQSVPIGPTIEPRLVQPDGIALQVCCAERCACTDRGDSCSRPISHDLPASSRS